MTAVGTSFFLMSGTIQVNGCFILQLNCDGSYK